jgi:hypothetical protein
MSDGRPTFRGPMRPDELPARKKQVIPEVVFRVVNDLLAENAVDRKRTITISQSEIVDRLVALGENKDEIFDKNWLDFEMAYHDVGWRVQYDGPGFNESFSAVFRFNPNGGCDCDS